MNGILITLPDLNINNIYVFILCGESQLNTTLNSLFSSGPIFPPLGVTIHPAGKCSDNIL